MCSLINFTDAEILFNKCPTIRVSQVALCVHTHVVGSGGTSWKQNLVCNITTTYVCVYT